MKYVCLLRSLASPDQRDVGLTSHVSERVRAHNAGQSIHTSKYRPWKLIAYCALRDGQRAIKFEKYLKSGSGRAFAKKHFW
jgi:predicted GIY-YIG superfamily endonuclease